METLSTDEWRKQLEINVIGQLAVTRAVLPRLRESRGPRRLHLQRQRPVVDAVDRCVRSEQVRAGGCRRRAANGAEPLADSRRRRRARTDRHRHVADRGRPWPPISRPACPPSTASLYARHVAGFKKMIPVSQQMAVPTEKVSAVVEEALTARRPRARYVVGSGPKAAGGLDGRLADEAARFAAAEGVRPTVGWRPSSNGIPGRPRVSSPAKPLDCNGFRLPAGGVPCAEVIDYDDTRLTLERLDVACRPERAAAHEFGQPAGAHP